MEQNLKNHDYHHAFLYGEKLFSLNPNIEKLYETLIFIAAKTKNWNQLISISDKAYSKKIIDKSLKTINMHKRKDEFVNNLSGGEMQILRIGRSLVQDVDLILLDEPTSSLDINNTILVKELILDLSKKGKDIIISTHDINFRPQKCSSAENLKNGQMYSKNGIMLLCSITVTCFRCYPKR